jgi:hypothetical protein
MSATLKSLRTSLATCTSETLTSWRASMAPPSTSVGPPSTSVGGRSGMVQPASVAAKQMRTNGKRRQMRLDIF